MKLAIIGMGIMGCNYAKMISQGLTQTIEEEIAFEAEYEEAYKVKKLEI